MPDRQDIPREIWLGYPGLSVTAAEISAVLRYQPLWERRLASSYGRVPPGVRAIVLLKDGRVLPARRALDDLRQQWLARRSNDAIDQVSYPIARSHPATDATDRDDAPL